DRRIVPPELGNTRTGVGCSSEEEIEVAVVVIIGPCHGTISNLRQPGGKGGGRHVGKGAIPVVPPQLGNGAAADASREQEIELAIVVIVPPRYGTLFNLRQPAGKGGGRHVGKGDVPVVPPELGNTRAAVG